MLLVDPVAVKNALSTLSLSWLAKLLLENQYPAPPVYAPKLEIDHTNSNELSETTITSMVKLAIIVLIAFRDLWLRRFLFSAHLIILTHSFDHSVAMVWRHNIPRVAPSRGIERRRGCLVRC